MIGYAQPMSPNVVIEQIEEFPEREFQTFFEKWLISDYPFLPWREQLSETQRSKLKSLSDRTKDRFELRLAVYHNREFAGWSFGYQESAHTYYMANSAIAPELRRTGVYTELITRTLDITREAGFQTVSSHHLLNNNPVIIAKLKA
ncbi:MAG: GNAT family N-acetyltransferase, partial [Proteobacteria bacterium]